MPTKRFLPTPPLLSATAVLGGLLLLAEQPVRSGPRVSVNAGLDKARVPLNRTATLSVRVEWEGELSDVEVDEPSEPHSDELELVGSGASSEVTSRDGKDIATKLHTYTLSPTKVGVAEIAPITVTYSETGSDDTQSLQTSRLKLEVIEPVSNGLSAPVRTGLLAFSAVALATLLIAAIVRARRVVREDAAEEGDEDVLTPSERALSQLEEHKALRIAGDGRGYCDAVAATLREYLATAFESTVKGLSTDQLLEELVARDANPDLINRTGAVLERCDVAKFAGDVPPPPELDELHDHVSAIAAMPVVAAPDEDAPAEESTSL